MYDLMGGLSLPLTLICVLLEGCSRFLEYTFFFVLNQFYVVNPCVDSFSCFSGNLFAVLISYFEVGDVGIGVIV